ncbi:MAG: transporter, partial [Sphingomonas bacterium]|nr:transporter [Sphingomonas bacterium]
MGSAPPPRLSAARTGNHPVVQSPIPRQPEAEVPVRGRRTVLAMLLLVYTFNFLDRQILGILVAPIKAELQLSDTQLGLLGG